MKFVCLFTRFNLIEKIRIQFRLISYRASFCFHRRSMFRLTRVSQLMAWPNSHFYWLIQCSEYSHYSHLLIDSMFRVFALLAFSSASTTLQLESKFYPLSLLPFFFGGSSLVVLNVNFLWLFTNFAFSCTSLQCCFKLSLTFPLSSNRILIFQFEINLKSIITITILSLHYTT